MPGEYGGALEEDGGAPEDDGDTSLGGSAAPAEFGTALTTVVEMSRKGVCSPTKKVGAPYSVSKETLADIPPLAWEKLLASVSKSIVLANSQVCVARSFDENQRCQTSVDLQWESPQNSTIRFSKKNGTSCAFMINHTVWYIWVNT